MCISFREMRCNSRNSQKKTYFCRLENWIIMAKKDNAEETIVDVQEVYTKTELFIDRNRKGLAMGIGAAILVVLAIIGYKYLIVQPTENEANEASWKAEQYFEIDSLDLALEGDGLYLGFLDIVEQHDGTKAAMRAHYNMGIIYRDRGDFESAIEHFQQANFNDDVMSILATGNIGDCHVEMGNVAEGLTFLTKAVNKAKGSNGAAFTAPIYMYKAAVANMELGNKEAAKGLFEDITEKYPTAQQSNDAKKYLAMLKAELS